MDDTIWTLFVIHATDGKRSELTQVYALDEAHARERAYNWIAAHSHMPEVTLRAFPGGFSMGRTWLDGKVEVTTWMQCAVEFLDDDAEQHSGE